MGVRVGGRDVRLDRAGLAGTFPEASDSVVVFVHGLCETEDYWNRRRRPRSDVPVGSYGERLARDEGWSPVFIRVNTGLSISENGAGLAALLGRLTTNWPVPVRRIALVGHSMGGLVLRAACAVTTDAAPDRSPWVDRVTDVVTLGAPHLGAPLERVVARGSKALGVLPESAPLGRILEYRSVGILDLRQGLAPDVQHLPHARYHLVAGSLTRSPRHPVALGIGDLLVQPRSALGRPRHGPEMFPGADALHVPGASHFDLLNHDDVYAALRRWLHRPDPA
jgi:pimeloyl-ACP methyl ester carboxylesterase